MVEAPHPHIEEVRRSLESWKGQPSRRRYVNDIPHQMVEVSIKAIQEAIDLLKEAEQGIVRTELRSGRKK